MGKVTGEISNFCFPNACKIELRAFREAGTFIRVDSEMCWLSAYFDNPDVRMKTALSLRAFY